MRARPSQLALPLRTHGGRRRGAGRKPAGRRPLVSHRERPRFARPAPAHVTLRMREHVWNLRSGRCYRRIRSCFGKALGRFGMRLIEFSVQGNHLHLIVEADSNRALSRGMQGLCIRIAKSLNGLMERAGSVFADHYHSRLLQTPTELVNAIAYVLGNHVRHYRARSAIDRFSSASLSGSRRALVIAVPRGWLLGIGRRRARPKPRRSS